MEEYKNISYLIENKTLTTDEEKNLYEIFEKKNLIIEKYFYTANQITLIINKSNSIHGEDIDKYINRLFGKHLYFNINSNLIREGFITLHDGNKIKVIIEYDSFIKYIELKNYNTFFHIMIITIVFVIYCGLYLYFT